eukprot:m.576967 g.576967  ORF g.576967 m.576967 type:complete len:128 (+) comp57903_c0_seq10:532-915(+)
MTRSTAILSCDPNLTRCTLDGPLACTCGHPLVLPALLPISCVAALQFELQLEFCQQTPHPFSPTDHTLTVDRTLSVVATTTWTSLLTAVRVVSCDEPPLCAPCSSSLCKRHLHKPWTQASRSQTSAP